MKPQDRYDSIQPITWPMYVLDPKARDPRDSKIVKSLTSVTTNYLRTFIETTALFVDNLQGVNLGSSEFIDTFLKYGSKDALKKYNKNPKKFKSVYVKRMEYLQKVFQYIAAMFNDSSMRYMMINIFLWYKSGRQIVVLGPNMQRLFEYTPLDELTINEIILPVGASIYVALPGFKGLMYDDESGAHEIGGVMISRISKTTEDLSSDYGNYLGINDLMAFTFWGKPKKVTHEGDELARAGMSQIYEDAWTYVVADLSIEGNLPVSDWIFKALGSTRIDEFPSDFRNPNKMAVPEADRLGYAIALRLAVNALVYWNSAGDRIDMVHPLMEQRNRRLSDLRQRLANAKGNKKRRGLESTIREEERKSRKLGEWHYLEPELKATGVPTIPNPQRTPRKSPVMHIRRGHWRRKPNDETKIYIKPTIVKGTGMVATTKDSLAPRYWRSVFDDFRTK
jgi:hypothetical protein